MGNTNIMSLFLSGEDIIKPMEVYIAFVGGFGIVTSLAAWSIIMCRKKLEEIVTDSLIFFEEYSDRENQPYKNLESRLKRRKSV